MGDLGRSLRELEDRLAIHDLISRYASTEDTPERLAAGEWEDCFTEDVVFVYPWGNWEGRAGITEQAQQVFAPNHYGQHVITNIVLELDGDSAKARSDFLMTLVRDHEGGTGHFHTGGYYLQEFRRTPDGWRFSRLEARSMWSSPMIPTNNPSGGGGAQPTNTSADTP